jgi:hypothetical protein
VLPGGVADGAGMGDHALLVTALAHAYDYLIFAASADEALRLAPHVDLAFVLGEDEAAEALREDLAEIGVEAHLLDASACGDLAA